MGDPYAGGLVFVVWSCIGVGAGFRAGKTDRLFLGIPLCLCVGGFVYGFRSLFLVFPSFGISCCAS